MSFVWEIRFSGVVKGEVFGFGNNIKGEELNIKEDKIHPLPELVHIIKHNTLFFLLFLFFTLANTYSFSQSQQGAKVRLSKVSVSEKIWAVKHPFVALRAIKITRHVLGVTDSIKNTLILDGDADGGQVDAFRHAYWMALLSSSIGERKALSLGKAHEKGNFRQFVKARRRGELISQDSIASAMDFFNNKIGSGIGITNKTADKKHIQNLIISSLLTGEMLIISKDFENNSLDCNGNLINSELLNFLWITPRCLVPSDTQRRN